VVAFSENQLFWLFFRPERDSLMVEGFTLIKPVFYGEPYGTGLTFFLAMMAVLVGEKEGFLEPAEFWLTKERFS
jgi:hypothetical protein